MSRFQITLLISLAACLAGFILKSPALIIVTILVFIAVSPLGVTFPQMKFFGPFICEGNSDRRAIALTFDDGPDPGSTAPLLDLLRDRNVPAAFFCIGKHVDHHPDVASRIVKEGHLLENHSYSHSNFTNLFMAPRLRDELERTRSAIHKAAGSKPSCFRPPMGLSNALIFKVATALNFRVVGWSARGLDTITNDPQRIVNRIIRQLKPGAIILLHDGNIPADRLVLTVKTLLDRVNALGYEVVRLDRLIS
jgi:peptidoglycan-N-acetylglucosamine deacetylase